MAITTQGQHCPDCGAGLSDEPWAKGLCFECLGHLGLDANRLLGPECEADDAPTLDPSDPIPSATPTALAPDSGAPSPAESPFAPGRLLGQRYRIEKLLGRGGMGEVWRAYDLKLRLEVALKSLHPRLFDHPKGLELLRAEVRAAREVVSPNVCRLFDLVDIEGLELVSMEYVDGVTLLHHLDQSRPLELKDANEIASQLLAGLEAIHQAGLVHRDVKPENVMLTRTGRVVIMDFGLTAETGTGSLGGTPAYMAPEQGRGEPVDARADVFSAGMVLAEMLSAEAGPEQSSRQTFWEAMRQHPPQIPDTPWTPIVRRAIALDRDDRFASAEELARALEEIAFRVEGAEHEHPYPGLASFQEADAEFFFGREAEVESLWQKLDQAHLLALVGASGSGKSSLVNAGLLPARPEGWSCLRMAPGRAPFAALGRTLLTELEGDPQATEALVALEDPESALVAFQRWRSRHDQALLIVDQFEELFTQSSEDVQHRFAELLGRTALDADVHVLLSMRDDFLLQCQRHSALRPLFSELTPLGPPTGSALRRAIVQPALRCGYRFEDDAVVEAMLEEVNRERGALPLIAFTAASLWEQRDHDTGYLTKEAYEEMGGVGGALARHADATLEAIGEERTPIVRELFRNLVTAQGTRATRDREELLSVFDSDANPEREAAEQVLDALIAARLLTSYEIPSESDDGGTEHHRIEIIHESLLAAWPRLVRWQDQDRAGAQLRDELRQQALLWQQHDRSNDYLWTGTAYREFELWRERYPGGLSAGEEAYARAMVSHAERRQRQRRIAATAAFAALLVVLTVVGGLWRHSVRESRRAEAATLLSQAELTLDGHPTGALAYAIAALELADNADLRRLVVDALWREPPEIRLATNAMNGIDFSPDGRWLLTNSGVQTLFWPLDGGTAVPLDLEQVVLLSERPEAILNPLFSPTGDRVAAIMGEGGTPWLVLWSFPEGRWLRSFPLGRDGDYTWYFQFSPDGERVITFTEPYASKEAGELTIRSWPVQGGEPDIVARFELDPALRGTSSGIDPSGSWLAWSEPEGVRLSPFEGGRLDLATSSLLPLEHPPLAQWFDWSGRQMVTVDTEGRMSFWSLEGRPELTRTSTGSGSGSGEFSRSGGYLAAGNQLWDLEAPSDAQAQSFQFADRSSPSNSVFSPDERWLAIGRREGVSFRPLGRRFPIVLSAEGVEEVHFLPDGRSLVYIADGAIYRSFLDNKRRDGPELLFQEPEGAWVAPRLLAVAPDASFVATASLRGQVRIHRLDGGPTLEFHDFSDVIKTLAVDPRSRLVAAGSGPYEPADTVVRIRDVVTNELRVIDAGDGERVYFVAFTSDGDLLVHSGTRLRRWQLSRPEPRMSWEIELPGEGTSDAVLDLSPDEKRILITTQGRLSLIDLDSGDRHEMGRHVYASGRGAGEGALFHPDGDLVIWSEAIGAVRAGAIGGAEAHLLIREGTYLRDVSPDGRWIASSGEGKILLWPLPDLSQPAIHTLPREQLLARLRALTNLRAVRDPGSSSGWKIEPGPFHGWEEVPTW